MNSSQILCSDHFPILIYEAYLFSLGNRKAGLLVTVNVNRSKLIMT